MSINNKNDAIINDILYNISFRKEAGTFEEIKEKINQVIDGKIIEVSLPLAGDIDSVTDINNPYYKNEMIISFKDTNTIKCEISSLWGQYTSSSRYKINEIEAKDVRYLPICQMRIDTKPIKEVDVLLSEVQTSYQVAKNILEMEQIASPKQYYSNYCDINDDYEIFIDDINKLKVNEWYKDQITRLKSSKEELMKIYNDECTKYNNSLKENERPYKLQEYVFIYHAAAYKDLFPEHYNEVWKPKEDEIELG